MKTLLIFLVVNFCGILCYGQETKPKVDPFSDTAFNSGSAITIDKLTDRQKENLFVLGKVWGFLKYHHPTIASGNLHWDYELFRVMPKILSGKNETERNLILYNWVKALGDFKTAKQAEIASIRYKPELDWINAKTFGNDLTALLKKVAIAERTPENFYVKIYSEDMPIPLFINESPYSQFQYPDVGFRLLSLYRYWNMIEYFYPYKATLPQKWDEALSSLIPVFVSAKDETEYKLAVAKLIAQIEDSHAEISFWYEPKFQNGYFGKFKPAAEITFVGDKPVISKSADEISGNKGGLLKGDEIISINNKPAQEILKERLPFASASNHPTRLNRISENFLRSKDSIVNIGILRDGVKRNLTIKALPHKKATIKKDGTEPYFKMIGSDIAYINPERLDVKNLDSIMKTAMNTKALIVDMRGYPKENMFLMSLGKYLLNKPTGFCKMTKGNVVTPGIFSYLSDSYMENIVLGGEGSPHYNGKLIVLANETTQSFAEMCLMAFKVVPNSMLIGSQTAGADGNVTPAIYLPGNIQTVFTGIGMYYPDGKETQRIGIVPDVEIKPTIQGIKEGKDEVLEKAASFAGEK